MFSYTINKTFILDNTDNYYVIPFGHRCTSAIACDKSDLRNFSLPFDWTIPLFPDKIQKVLEHNFEDFIPNVHENNYFTPFLISNAHFEMIFINNSS
jgi:hypothetical protein